MKYKGWYISKKSKFYSISRSEYSIDEYTYFVTLAEAKDFIDNVLN